MQTNKKHIKFLILKSISVDLDLAVSDIYFYTLELSLNLHILNNLKKSKQNVF